MSTLIILRGNSGSGKSSVAKMLQRKIGRILNANWYKPLFETATELYKEKLFAYYYDIPFEETLRRHETKEKKFEFGEAEMLRWWNEKDFIGIIPEKSFKQDVSLESAVNIILKDISM